MTQDNKVISIQDRIAKLDDAEVQAMKSLMVAIQEAEAKSPGVQANTLVNDLVDLMLMLTQNECLTFSRSIRQIMDSVVDARSTYRDVSSFHFSEREKEGMTSHQRLVMEIQRDLHNMESRSMDADIAKAITNAGFEPRRPVTTGPTEFEKELEEDMADIKRSDALEARMSHLEGVVLAELSEIKQLLAQSQRG